MDKIESIIKHAIENNISAVEIIKEYLEKVKFFARNFIRARWDEIDYYLKNPDKFIEKYVKDEKLKELLLKNKGWLLRNCKELYDYLYQFAWK